MKALRFKEGTLAISDIAEPVADGEALVRVTLSGICNTDLEIARGYAGFEGTLGHEFVGVIEEVSDDGAVALRTGSPARAARVGSIGSAQSEVILRVGDRVVGEINAGCGVCDLCRAGDPRHCPRRTVLGIVGRDGAHAEFLKLPLVNLLPVPDEIPDERAVFTEPLAAACGILERVSITEDIRVAVIGDGKLGLLCAQVVATTGAKVTLIGKHRAKLAIAARRGIETNTIAEAHQRKGEFGVTVEASGSPTGFALAVELLHPRGVVVLKSTFHGATEIEAAPLVVNEITVVGSRCGRFAPALDLLKQNAIDVDSLVSDEFALSDGLSAMRRAAERDVMKVLLRP
ncbi:MAG TPA: alcohol dehydrogenase catalytic domain-containing protein [Pyrinomonadaceae bacterium]|nr:alcohol dehydrogenase catalytic domain-containing protein [Pyrinomonadaceae bacterium]